MFYTPFSKTFFILTVGELIMSSTKVYSSFIDDFFIAPFGDIIIFSSMESVFLTDILNGAVSPLYFFSTSRNSSSVKSKKLFLILA